MKFDLNILKNGLRVLTVAMPSLESATVTVWAKTGSRNEETSVSGISHFLEHMAFKGGRKYKSQEEVTYELDSLGSEYNAGTSNEWTNFYIKLRSAKLEMAFDILSDMVVHSNLEEKQIEKERGVILEEISMHLDTPMWNIGDIFSELMFPNHPLGRDIAGTPESVKSLHREDFLNYRKRQYHTNSMFITVVGSFRSQEALDLSEKYFGSLTKGEVSKFEGFNPNQKSPRLKLKSKETEQAHFILGFYGHERTHKDRYAEGLLSIILGKGMSSRLFTEVRTKRGLAYSISTSIERYIDCGIFATYAGVHPDKISESIKVILDQIYGIASGRYPLTVKELQKAKEYVKGKTALGLEDTTEVSEYFGQRALFLPKIDTPEEFFKRIDKIELAELEKISRDIFNPKKVNLAIIGPYKNEEKFAKLLT
ncbi:hypothetical protein A2962_03470 [Candidatus Woesebacteria bacterium RIFCSPLOWO2_01_FULL_39_61]|uniref:Peptidase M16 n=1 Tax=Candidatus Woesebacteria bacterium RIFCSPHIGHO2_02_FULL_39_13 TaxID=1802505 RepID=A0A1F7Z3X6_9BACT|nr:MAG: hypothetical protein A2692_00600 [Candidatus Woesebacteria bacterium RIFCSPHIGHO2_01_FULL_39_95]OGM34110.1 MAG: hypothetical protein A3D01_00055 [Candidatus Woesebacteria bacterium RIFCSPHIGHO2_02_FULL_39_13]OGM38709.1 MAG: hypothetical protein A3E13_03790 [Candidatus Woesebacteria bacterium RIFCSPHIGHO2_12_FULL_40_20]OGM67570.1 MAG: hypothetical protein A2962_03470 [Candidatus Woesebacteria bacterium RIFCSPLOWO2_01_FULL_39_61]OGM74270.1 MAG: hypothetical protein A3H19_01970 [Candidatus